MFVNYLTSDWWYRYLLLTTVSDHRVVLAVAGLGLSSTRIMSVKAERPPATQSLNPKNLSWCSMHLKRMCFGHTSCCAVGDLLEGEDVAVVQAELVQSLVVQGGRVRAVLFARLLHMRHVSLPRTTHNSVIGFIDEVLGG